MLYTHIIKFLRYAQPGSAEITVDNPMLLSRDTAKTWNNWVLTASDFTTSMAGSACFALAVFFCSMLMGYCYVYCCTCCYSVAFRVTTNAWRSKSDGADAVTVMHIIVGTHATLFKYPLDDPTPCFARTFGIPVWTDASDYVKFCQKVI